MKAKELRDLVISALVLALAFGIALSGGFRAFNQPGTLVLVIGMALVAVSLGFVFAAPGAVIIYPRATKWGTISLSREKVGLISIAGPATNICLSVVFLVLDVIQPSLLFTLGARVNIWLAMFNLIPFGPLDGAKILKWNKGIWLIAIAGAGGLFVAQRFFF